MQQGAIQRNRTWATLGGIFQNSWVFVRSLWFIYHILDTIFTLYSILHTLLLNAGWKKGRTYTYIYIYIFFFLTLYKLYSVFHTLYSILYTLYSIPHAMYHILYTIISIPYIIYHTRIPLCLCALSGPSLALAFPSQLHPGALGCEAAWEFPKAGAPNMVYVHTYIERVYEMWSIWYMYIYIYRVYEIWSIWHMMYGV